MGSSQGDWKDELQVAYLSLDSVSSTVGSSQVLAYVRRLADRGVSIHLHSFEHAKNAQLAEDLAALGIQWTPHRFGASGARGGLGRVLRLAFAIRGARVAHARSDMAAAAAMLAGVDRWLWDVRSFWADQKVATGVFTQGSLQARIFRQIERKAASRSTRIVTLTPSAIAELDRRYGGFVSERAKVVTTCVDRRRFLPSPVPTTESIRLLLAGTLNRYYDIPLMVEFVRVLQRRVPVELIVASPAKTGWEKELGAVGAVFVSVTPEEMPDLIATCHVGLGVCRDDAGPSLLAAMPTKIGEFLAVGRAVVVNSGLADAASFLDRHRAGIALNGEDGLDAAAERLIELVKDPETRSRAVELAAEHFDLDQGVDQLVDLYGELCTGMT